MTKKQKPSDQPLEKCKVTICEDYCVKTQAEVDQILKNCADIYIDYLREKASLAKEK